MVWSSPNTAADGAENPGLTARNTTMSDPAPYQPKEEDIHWYAIHTKAKSEHIATAHLKLLDPEMQVFCPRIRFQKKTND